MWSLWYFVYHEPYFHSSENHIGNPYMITIRRSNQTILDETRRDQTGLSEQSRAEQSRAEQSRAEQSRADQCLFPSLYLSLILLLGMPSPSWPCLNTILYAIPRAMLLAIHHPIVIAQSAWGFSTSKCLVKTLQQAATFVKAETFQHPEREQNAVVFSASFSSSWRIVPWQRNLTPFYDNNNI